jgi:phage shock protein E
MKINTILFLFFASAISTFAQPSPQKYTQKSPNKIVVTSQDSRKILSEVEADKAYLIDVRAPEEFNEKHLKYARNINIRSAEFGSKISQLDKRKPIYLYCRSGSRSGKATDSLLTLGYPLSYNIGGLDSLAKAGLPVDQYPEK